MSQPQRLVLIDGHSLLFRAYFAFPPLSDSQGRLVNAAYGFTSMLLNVMEELEPEYIALTFDTAGGTFRNELYQDYKANRQEPPEDFLPQIPITQDVVESLGIPQFVERGWEADDLIGTLAQKTCELNKGQLKDPDYEAVIVTADKDMFQLVQDDCIKVFIPARKQVPSIIYDSAEVLGKMKVRPDQIVDFKALAGDSSDNIPGVKGVGPKTAVGLLERFDTLEKLYEALEETFAELSQESRDKSKEFKAKAKEFGLGPSAVSKLITDKENAFLSQKLARIKTDAPITFNLESCRVSGYDKSKAIELFQELRFKSLINRLPQDEFEMDVQEALF